MFFSLLVFDNMITSYFIYIHFFTIKESRADSRAQLKAFISRLGGWPLVSGQDNTKTSIESLLAGPLDYGTQALIKTTIEPWILNRSQQVIMVRKNDKLLRVFLILHFL